MKFLTVRLNKFCNFFFAFLLHFFFKLVVTPSCCQQNLVNRTVKNFTLNLAKTYTQHLVIFYQLFFCSTFIIYSNHRTKLPFSLAQNHLQTIFNTVPTVKNNMTLTIGKKKFFCHCTPMCIFSFPTVLDPAVITLPLL